MTVQDKELASRGRPAGEAVAGGLDDVVVARTALSHVDGDRGRLTIAGSPLESLAAEPVEAVAARLWCAALGRPVAAEVTAGIGIRLGRGRMAAWASQEKALAAGRGLPPMEGLIAAMAAFGPAPDTAGAGRAGEGRAAAAAWRVDGDCNDTGIGLPAEPFRLTGAVAVFLPALLRQARGQPPIAPDEGMPHAADILRMLSGTAPGAAEAAALNRYLVTVSDHGMNASTFAARVVASTRAGMAAAVLAALCALKGPLHGGAPGPVLDMLDEAAAQPDLHAWLRAGLAAGERIMGFGHRVYRVRDPRADVLRAAAASLSSRRLTAAAELERAVLTELATHRPGRKLETNVEFMTAVLLDALDLPRDAFTTIFAAGRVVGWTAHVLEQERTGRLIRPQSDHVAPPGPPMDG